MAPGSIDKKKLFECKNCITAYRLYVLSFLPWQKQAKKTSSERDEKGKNK